jgi:hypothetical protein
VTHIDVRSALQDSVVGDFSDLVTRRTGAAVRTVIERQIAGLANGTVVFLDFSHIGVLDHSCADEFVAKLMLPLTDDHPAREGYVVFHGISECHVETIESVLEAHGLALVVQFADGAMRLVGAVTEAERRCWELVMQQGAAPADAVASEIGLPGELCSTMLEGLARRRLLRRDADRYLPLGTAA